MSHPQFSYEKVHFKRFQRFGDSFSFLHFALMQNVTAAAAAKNQEFLTHQSYKAVEISFSTALL